MLKEKLMQEAKEITASVDLDSIFQENENISKETKDAFTIAFQESVKKHAVELAEKHIEEIAQKADSLVESTVETKYQEYDKQQSEMIESYLDHISREWLSENTVEVHKGIKSDLFESMFTEIKRVIVEHNVVIPDESIDIVAEMEDDLVESKQEVESLFSQLSETKKELNTIKKDQLTEQKTAHLTESQKEKVLSLVEELEFNDKYDSKLTAIVKMAESQKGKVEPVNEAVTKPLNESGDQLNFNNQNQNVTYENENMVHYLKY